MRKDVRWRVDLSLVLFWLSLLCKQRDLQCLDGSLVLRAHLVGPGAGQTARQRAAVGRQSGGERRAAVGQNGFKVAERLLKGINSY